MDTKKRETGSHGRDRTDDNRLIETVLYLLSYMASKMMAPQRGHDPRTSALTVRRSTN